MAPGKACLATLVIFVTVSPSERQRPIYTIMLQASDWRLSLVASIISPSIQKQLSYMDKVSREEVHMYNYVHVGATAPSSS